MMANGERSIVFISTPTATAATRTRIEPEAEEAITNSVPDHPQIITKSVVSIDVASYLRATANQLGAIICQARRN